MSPSHPSAPSLNRRPELNPKAGFGERLQHQLWYKRHPDYEGASSERSQ